jgi:glycosyltransferase involved in cell wall biosynthesis
MKMRRALGALGRRMPILRGVFRQLDDLRAANAALAGERDHAEKTRWEVVAEREIAGRARWAAVRQRDEAEKARWEAVAEREIAERARWAAVRQREEAEAARRQALLGGRSFSYRPPAPVVTAPQGEQARGKPVAGLNGGSLPDVQPGAMKISIVLPNYNHGAFIRGNIAGVCAQTYANWELVIVDDGSTDGSRATIESFAQSDARIVPIFLPENRGVVHATQRGLATASGELLYGSAADDYIANERFFEFAVAALANAPEAAGVFGKAMVVDAESSAELWCMGSAPTNGLVAPQQALETFFKGGLFVPGAAAIWKRSLVDALGGFDPNLGPQTDFFVNHALPIVFGAVFVDEVFAIVRAGTGNYHQAGSEEDFFRHHALLETKLRALDLPAPLDPIWLRIWRDRLINSRLGVTRQQQIYASLRGALTNIYAWERDSLPAELNEFSSRILADVSRWERELEERVTSAHRTFDAMAGSLGLEHEAPQ